MKHFSFGKFLAHFFLLIIVFIWVIPTFGLLISSLRDKDQVALTGWWTALKHNEFNGSVFYLRKDGTYRWSSDKEFKHKKGKRIFLTVSTPPSLTLENYKEVLVFRGLGQSFINSLTVAVPSTIIPLIIGAFAAYALSWMNFYGRDLIFATIVCLLVVGSYWLWFAFENFSIEEFHKKPTARDV